MSAKSEFPVKFISSRSASEDFAIKKLKNQPVIQLLDQMQLADLYWIFQAEKTQNKSKTEL